MDRLRLFHIALQPTTLCNLDCGYCYLPLRRTRSMMQPEVTVRLARDIAAMRRHVRLVWHAGEPLACGLDHFRRLLEPLTAPDCAPFISHNIQTNGTLIDRSWCELFREFNFDVGVSIDGPYELTSRRVDYAGKQAFEKIQRGIECLRESAIRFAVIAVVGASALGEAVRIYDFACQLGCWVLCINIEETEGPHIAEQFSRASVVAFWRDLYRAWRRNPAIQIREFARTVRLMRAVSSTSIAPTDFSSVEVFPSIGADGHVVLLSPELLDNAPKLVVGNVLEESLTSIIARASKVPYVTDYLRGVARCSVECSYFEVCGGGAASNRFFETGRFDVTETDFCRNRTQFLTDGLLSVMEEAQ